MKLIKIFFSCVLLSVLSCNSHPTPKAIEINEEKAATDSLRMHVNTSEIDSVKIIFTDDESIQAYMSKEDQTTFFKKVEVAEYDTLWNDSDIMIKMVAPDYTLFVVNKNQPDGEMDILMLWKENGKLKFRNIWYILPENAQEDVYKLLEKYRS